MSIRKGTVLISGHGAVNDPTVSFTQGGASRGSITLNQANSATIAFEAGGSGPVGTICAFAGSSAPIGWLICNGGEISRTTYADLFAIISTTYGSGDGSTTFNIPNLEARIPTQRTDLNMGATGDGELPNITGSFATAFIGNQNTGVYSGAFNSTKYNPGQGAASNTGWSGYYNLNANLSKSAYSRNDNMVLPRYLVTKYIIKY